jgi:hypothetical protein
MDDQMENQMDFRLVFDLVCYYGIHPSYLIKKRQHADDMHRIICSVGVCTRETSVSGMMELLKWISKELLDESLYIRCEQVDRYYPLRIRGLHLF